MFQPQIRSSFRHQRAFRLGLPLALTVLAVLCAAPAPLPAQDCDALRGITLSGGQVLLDDIVEKCGDITDAQAFCRGEKLQFSPVYTGADAKWCFVDENKADVAHEAIEGGGKEVTASGTFIAILYAGEEGCDDWKCQKYQVCNPTVIVDPECVEDETQPNVTVTINDGCGGPYEIAIKKDGVEMTDPPEFTDGGTSSGSVVQKTARLAPGSYSITVTDTASRNSVQCAETNPDVRPGVAPEVEFEVQAIPTRQAAAP